MTRNEAIANILLTICEDKEEAQRYIEKYLQKPLDKSQQMCYNKGTNKERGTAHDN